MEAPDDRGLHGMRVRTWAGLRRSTRPHHWQRGHDVLDAAGEEAPRVAGRQGQRASLAAVTAV